ncbi:Very-long-chain 3-oxoacyl-CoA synthase [Citrus sinensis]|uniref:Very-long-chain 3-oxoacyl-CoA synthase n=1 Tax=Citrus sinensis TaxID=2711 RepID=A0ACB8KBJ5_CITSI|nr:Very-long-chain 3-oxoacyl-CoA synthase [Citrus sinensis]
MSKIPSALSQNFINSPVPLNIISSKSFSPQKPAMASYSITSLTSPSHSSSTTHQHQHHHHHHLSLDPTITAVHNLTLLLLSVIMAVGCTLSIILHLPHLHCTLCFPPTISPSGPLFFYAYIFYLSKILEFLDTLLIILSNSVQRLTFLHVYHHATVVVMCFLWLQMKQSLASSQIHQ